MSVRAYKVISKKHEDNCTFNLWQDEKLVAWLEKNTDFYSQLGVAEAGEASIEVKDIKTILLMAKELQLDEETVGQFSKDIEGLEENDFVTYDCF